MKGKKQAPQKKQKAAAKKGRVSMTLKSIDFADVTKGVSLANDDDFAAIQPGLLVASEANKVIGRAAAAPGLDTNALLQMLMALVMNYINRPPTTTPPPVGTTPTPDPSPSPVPPTPAPVPNPPPSPPAAGVRKVTRIALKYFWITEDGKLLSKAQFDAVLSRDTPLREGARVCLDATPIDQFGRELKPDAYEPFAWKPDGTPRMRYYGNNGDLTRITGGEHSLGCTPKVKVDKGTLEDNQEGETGEVYGVWEGDDEEVASNALPSLRVKGEKDR